MKCSVQTIYIILFLFLISACDQIDEDLKSEKKIKHQAKVIEVNGHILLPIPSVRDLTFDDNKQIAVFEYSISENKLKKSDFKLPQNLISIVEFQGKYFGATEKSIATYHIRESALEPDKFLQTPKGDFVGALITNNEKVNSITISENQIDIYELNDSEWANIQSITCKKEQTPQSIPTYIKFGDNNLLFWSNAKNLFCLNFGQPTSTIKQISISEISNFKVWLYKDKIIASGFDTKNDFLHYEISNINSSITISKIDLGKYPAFNSTFKVIDVLPIIINEQIKGFVYGAIKDTPVFIPEDNKTFPSDLVSNFNNEIKNMLYLNFGILIAIIFLSATLAHKASNAWENKFAKLKINIPENSVFFGPAFNRGIAYTIDLLLMLLISLVLIVTLPFKVDIFSQIIQWALESGQSPLQEHTTFFILTYCVNIVYGTISEYFYGQTLGKYCMGLKVFSDISLKKISFLQALCRNLIPKFPPNTLLILASNISITFVHKKKSLNDYAGNSVVLYHRLHQKLNLSINITHDQPQQN